MKGTKEWRDWLIAAAKHAGLSVSAFMDLAAAEYAKQTGYKRKPPER